MQSAATIHDAARRLEEASAVFRMKSRGALEEYTELGAHWNDSRAQRFTIQHIEPQRDLIEQGARLCHVHAALVETARATADQAEQELSGFFVAQSAFESAAESERHSASVARDQTTRAAADSARASAEVRSISAAIASAAIDPGW